jgi:hypothetical protein
MAEGFHEDKFSFPVILREAKSSQQAGSTSRGKLESKASHWILRCAQNDSFGELEVK